jgi:biotin carboxylase
MLVKNVSKRRYMHSFGDDIVILEAGATKEIPDVIANIWIKTNDVIVVDDGSKDAEIERLKAENEKLKAMAKGNEAEDVSEKEALIEKCKEYGIRFGNPKTVSVETLKKKIEEYEAKNEVK